MQLLAAKGGLAVNPVDHLTMDENGNLPHSDM